MRPAEFWNGKSGGAKLLSFALAPAGFLYGASVAWKARNATPHRAKAKVVCVGNLTVGGTGKTPVCLALARMLAAQRLRTVILSRGYGGRERGPIFVHPNTDRVTDVGDEALMMAASAHVIVARDRRQGAELADLEEMDAIIMDDGHQNFSLVKDLSLVVVDAQTGFGNGHVLPAGPLREPVKAGLARADAVVLTGDGAPGLAGYKGQILRARLKPAESGLRGKRVAAFAGIGRPEKFFESLKTLGALLIAETEFPDHHNYSAAEIARLKAKAAGADAVLVTTEKDFARLTPAERHGVTALRVSAEFDEPGRLQAMLDKLWPGGIPRRP